MRLFFKEGVEIVILKNLWRIIVIPAKAGIHGLRCENGFQIEFGMTKVEGLRFFVRHIPMPLCIGIYDGLRMT
ncbi:hypothetical protein DRO47_04670 [Candidatus Bathyarchaeota archaeon]|nr:MAG: hypothetical protein DRO47_04670 [Candidatus Bathyarchaeota archaeon]